MAHHSWQRAVSFAARSHHGQFRDDGETPYIAHPLRVAMIVRDTFACDDAVAIEGAILHDTIEDTPVDYDDIEEGFGRGVADCVAAMTKNMLLRYEEREADYDARLARADWRARIVKLADCYDNLSDALEKRKPARSLANMLARCERALALAAADASLQPASRRAIDALRALMDEVGQRVKTAPAT